MPLRRRPSPRAGPGRRAGSAGHLQQVARRGLGTERVNPVRALRAVSPKLGLPRRPRKPRDPHSSAAPKACVSAATRIRIPEEEARGCWRLSGAGLGRGAGSRDGTSSVPTPESFPRWAGREGACTTRAHLTPRGRALGGLRRRPGAAAGPSGKRGQRGPPACASEGPRAFATAGARSLASGAGNMRTRTAQARCARSAERSYFSQLLDSHLQVVLLLTSL